MHVGVDGSCIPHAIADPLKNIFVPLGHTELLHEVNQSCPGARSTTLLLKATIYILLCEIYCEKSVVSTTTRRTLVLHFLARCEYIFTGTVGH